MSQQIDYAELQVTTNYSFLRGASHPHEYIWKAAELGLYGIAITDFNSLAGIVRAHTAAREAGVRLAIGARLEVDFRDDLNHQISNRLTAPERFSILVYPTCTKSYATLCALLTRAKRDLSKDDFFLSLADLLKVKDDLIAILVPPCFQTRCESNPLNQSLNSRMSRFYDLCKIVRDNWKLPTERLSIAVTSNYGHLNNSTLKAALQISYALNIPAVATNDVYYHAPERKPLQDLLTAIRLKTTVESAGYSLFPNGERYLKAPKELARLFKDLPHAITRSKEIFDQVSQFSLGSLKYSYPEEVTPPNTSSIEHLRSLALSGAQIRYPTGVPEKVLSALDHELKLIEELKYEKYFLTCHDIVNFARSREILCQGRGAAANSVVCFCLGITAVNPEEIDLLFARFVSKERQEPPDIDIDFEHERREEVIQYIYSRYGRDRAALTAEVVTFQPRSAVREVGKALGLSLEVLSILSKNIHRWSDYQLDPQTIREIGLNPFDQTVQNTLFLAAQLIGFPRHLSQHVGGFIISDAPLHTIVPVINASMEGRTIIEWDKNDIEELGMLKIDILALGMLTCIRKALALVNARRDKPLTLYSIPHGDGEVYQMLCASDTIGVFQVESRAQMAMLPRLRPRCFYDLVIQVAIVRPGPIQGNMVHPFLRRRSGAEKFSFPDKKVANILGKTLGVPIFQEQAMRLAITLANFSPGDAEKLRRAMAAWKTHNGVIATFKERIIRGMTANGYSLEFAESCLNQIKGFSEYGFPESHAASFALLVYASAWLKRHYPAEFACALLNSQPMGFYAPAQIVRDAENHGVKVLPIDVNSSAWECSVDYNKVPVNQLPCIRLGLKLIRGLRRDYGEALANTRLEHGEFTSLKQLHHATPKGSRSSLSTLARADAFKSLNLSRQDTHWELLALNDTRAPLDKYLTPSLNNANFKPEDKNSIQGEMFKDYAATGLSLRSHPFAHLRESLKKRGCLSAEQLLSKHGLKAGSRVSAGGLVITRQRPGTAKGVVFITLEDETGWFNLIIRPRIFEASSKLIMLSSSLIATGKLERIGEVCYIDVVSLI
jgi:error-prone DNA polymerase